MRRDPLERNHKDYYATMITIALFGLPLFLIAFVEFIHSHFKK